MRTRVTILFLLAITGASVAALGWVAALSLMAIIYYAACFLRPSAALAWSFAILPFSVPEFKVAGVTLRPFELFVWPAATIAILASLHEGRRLPLHEVKKLLPSGLFLVYILAGSLLLWGATSALEIRLWTSSFLLMAACYLRSDDEDTQHHLIRALTFGACAMALVAVSQRLSGAPFFARFEEPRDLVQLLLLKESTPVRLANSTFQHPNAAGAYLTLVIPVLLSASLRSRSLAARLGCTAALTALYLTYSRGATVAALVSIVLVLWFLSEKRQKKWILAGAIAVGLVVLLLVMPAFSVSEYALTFSLGVRYMIWQAYFHAWQSSPLIGLGPGNSFREAQFLSPYGAEYVAHSNYLYLAADFGGFGLAVAVWFFGSVFVRALRESRAHGSLNATTVGVAGAIVALGVHSFVDHTLAVFAYRAGLLGLMGIALRGPVRSLSQPPLPQHA